MGGPVAADPPFRRAGVKPERLPGDAPLFAALGDQTRLAILVRLGEQGPQSATRLAEEVDVSRQAVTKHLKILEAAGLADNRRRGRERIWELRPDPLQRIGHDLQRISRRWDMALERLRAMVEEEAG